MAYNKLNRPSDQRKAMLRSQVTALLWKGKIVTTKARAKEVQRIAEKQITKAIAQHKNTVTVKKSVKDEKGNIVEQEFVVDAPAKLAARRQLIAELYNVRKSWKRRANPSIKSARRTTTSRLWKSCSVNWLPNMRQERKPWARAADTPAS